MLPLPQNLLFKSLNSLLIITHEIEAVTHSHHALQVTISMDQAFDVKCETKESSRCHGIIIGADMAHSIQAETGLYATLMLDPELHPAKHILGHHQTTGCAEIDSDRLAKMQNYIQTLMADQFSDCQVKIEKPIEALMSILSQSDCQQALDPRIDTLIQYIAQAEHKMASLEELAQVVGLSSGRLIHLFKEEVGIPIRRYLLWQRLLDACAYASLHAHDEVSCEGKPALSLTDAAHQAGFTDSAHFSRTFKSMFGLHPSSFIKRSHMVSQNS